MQKPLSAVTRRTLLQAAAAATAAALFESPLLASTPEKPPRHNRIHQSVSRWCYKDIPLDHLCTAAAEMGLKGIDLLQNSPSSRSPPATASSARWATLGAERSTRP